MPRISEIEDAGGDATLRRVFDAERELFDMVLAPSRVMAHRPGILRAAKGLYAACEASGLLPKGLLALVYTRVATINGCPF